MARQGEEENGGSLDSAIDNVFGPMTSNDAEGGDDTSADDDAGSSDEGEGGAQPNISREKIVKTLIPIPPISEQKIIVGKIKNIDSILDNL